MANRPLHRTDGGHDLRHGVALRADLSRRHSHVWQEAEPAGNSEVDQVRVDSRLQAGKIESVGASAQTEVKSDPGIRPFSFSDRVKLIQISWAGLINNRIIGQT